VISPAADDRLRLFCPLAFTYPFHRLPPASGSSISPPCILVDATHCVTDAARDAFSEVTLERELEELFRQISASSVRQSTGFGARKASQLVKHFTACARVVDDQLSKLVNRRGWKRWPVDEVAEDRTKASVTQYPFQV